MLRMSDQGSQYIVEFSAAVALLFSPVTFAQKSFFDINLYLVYKLILECSYSC